MIKKQKIKKNYIVGLLTVGAIIAIIIFVAPENEVDTNVNLNTNITNYNLNEYSDQVVFTSVYENNQFGISFGLPDNWSFEESPSFIDGVMTYDGNNIVFKDNADEKFGFMLSSSNNESNFSTAEKYVNYLLEENKRLYKTEETPYEWEYDKGSEIKLGEITGYILQNMKGPGGYQDKIYVVGEENIFEFIYSYSDEDGISRVDAGLREIISKILNTLKISNE